VPDGSDTGSGTDAGTAAAIDTDARRPGAYALRASSFGASTY
jgi:hypothetical protein